MNANTYQIQVDEQEAMEDDDDEKPKRATNLYTRKTKRQLSDLCNDPESPEQTNEQNNELTDKKVYK